MLYRRMFKQRPIDGEWILGETFRKGGQLEIFGKAPVGQ
jgi:hypothetical protein